jgi:hypothetical protein
VAASSLAGSRLTQPTDAATSGHEPPPIARFAPANVRAALWAMRALRATRRALPAHGIDSAGYMPDPPASAPDAAVRGVRAVIARRRASCLERALVLQAWTVPTASSGS